MARLGTMGTKTQVVLRRTGMGNTWLRKGYKHTGECYGHRGKTKAGHNRGGKTGWDVTSHFMWTGEVSVYAIVNLN